MTGLQLFLVGLALPLVAGGLIGAGLYLRARRRKAYGFVQGLYLEATAAKPLIGNVTVGHGCSFKPCPHEERENDRRATAARVKGGRS